MHFCSLSSPLHFFLGVWWSIALGASIVEAFSTTSPMLQHQNREHPARRRIFAYNSFVRESKPLCAISRTSKEEQIAQEKSLTKNVIFRAPLLDYGYAPTVQELQVGELAQKPMLLYLPGFDGTYICPFIQFPELGTEFDIRCMTVGMDDRSTFKELIDNVLYFIQQLDDERPIYIAGESFGGILACEVANTMLSLDTARDFPSIKGLILINPATSYDRSALQAAGPPVAKLPSLSYPFGLAKLLPLFTDEFSFPQLLLILNAKALPSVIDTPAREAYMGRVAISLPTKLDYMSQGTLRWRLTEWLSTGCERVQATLKDLSNKSQLRTLIVAGENDETLPSTEEAKRLAALLPNSKTHVVQGAGHASTCGSRADIAAAIRSSFPELQGTSSDKRTAMKKEAISGKGPYFGMTERYDRASIGLNPMKYWSNENYLPTEIRSEQSSNGEFSTLIYEPKSPQ
eukprot:scaffold1034_cov127-Cylindrotheca_fusiformis.AAC.3